MAVLPSVQYQQDIDSGLISGDESQQRLLKHLDLLCLELTRQNQFFTFIKKLFNLIKPISGLYIYGDVGRGKTYLMDLFFKSLAFKEKSRIHFHRFMRQVHQDLKKLQDIKARNPLVQIAKQYAKKSRVLCFDEFYVEDVTDAMILGGLIQALFAEGITLVATSNIKPDDLYHNGVHRDRFLPAIELIQRYTTTVNLDGARDYRLRALKSASLYYSPNDESAHYKMQAMFNKLSALQRFSRQPLTINFRQVDIICHTDNILWCEFSELCKKACGQIDYIEIANEYSAVLLSNVPILDEQRDDQARRFISLVDEFYDRRVKLILSAVLPISEIYQGRQNKFEFERTKSRLIEMQSHAYLALEHRG